MKKGRKILMGYLIIIIIILTLVINQKKKESNSFYQMDKETQEMIKELVRDFKPIIQISDSLAKIEMNALKTHYKGSKK